METLELIHRWGAFFIGSVVFLLSLLQVASEWKRARLHSSSKSKYNPTHGGHRSRRTGIDGFAPRLIRKMLVLSGLFFALTSAELIEKGGFYRYAATIASGVSTFWLGVAVMYVAYRLTIAFYVSRRLTISMSTRVLLTGSLVAFGFMTAVTLYLRISLNRTYPMAYYLFFMCALYFFWVVYMWFVFLSVKNMMAPASQSRSTVQMMSHSNPSTDEPNSVGESVDVPPSLPASESAHAIDILLNNQEGRSPASKASGKKGQGNSQSRHENIIDLAKEADSHQNGPSSRPPRDDRLRRFQTFLTRLTILSIIGFGLQFFAAMNLINDRDERLDPPAEDREYQRKEGLFAILQCFVMLLLLSYSWGPLSIFHSAPSPPDALSGYVVVVLLTVLLFVCFSPISFRLSHVRFLFFFLLHLLLVPLSPTTCSTSGSRTSHTRSVRSP